MTSSVRIWVGDLPAHQPLGVQVQQHRRIRELTVADGEIRDVPHVLPAPAHHLHHYLRFTAPTPTRAVLNQVDKNRVAWLREVAEPAI